MATEAALHCRYLDVCEARYFLTLQELGQKLISARDKKCTNDSSYYDVFFLTFFYACALQFYVVFFFYHKA